MLYRELPYSPTLLLMTSIIVTPPPLLSTPTVALTSEYYVWPRCPSACGCWLSPAGSVTVLDAASGKSLTSAICMASGMHSPQMIFFPKCLAAPSNKGKLSTLFSNVKCVPKKVCFLIPICFPLRHILIVVATAYGSTLIAYLDASFEIPYSLPDLQYWPKDSWALGLPYIVLKGTTRTRKAC